MRWTPISQATLGMVLGEPVLDSQGRILAKKGESLSADQLRLLETAGVRDLLVAENTDTAEFPGTETAPDQTSAEIAGAIRKKLDLRFRKHHDTPLMQTIRNLAEKHLIQVKLSTLPK